VNRAALLPVLLLIPSCGYRLAGTADTIPKTVKTIAVPPFANATTQYKLTDHLANAIARELNSRTNYDVIQDPTRADAVLSGVVASVLAFPTTFDPRSGRAAGVEMAVTLSIQLRERETGNLIYTQPSYSFRQRYEISIDPAAYFEESSTAFARLSQDVARTVVTAILENF
jgi:outer membrane lipopolysaccharide assembly protein LptE/RlpB